VIISIIDSKSTLDIGDKKKNPADWAQLSLLVSEYPLNSFILRLINN